MIVSSVLCGMRKSICFLHLGDLRRIGQSHQIRKSHQHRGGDNPEANCGGDIEQSRFRRAPASADQLAQTQFATTMQAPCNVGNDDPFECHGHEVEISQPACLAAVCWPLAPPRENTIRNTTRAIVCQRGAISSRSCRSDCGTGVVVSNRPPVTPKASDVFGAHPTYLGERKIGPPLARHLIMSGLLIV